MFESRTGAELRSAFVLFFAVKDDSLCLRVFMFLCKAHKEVWQNTKVFQ